MDIPDNYKLLYIKLRTVIAACEYDRLYARLYFKILMNNWSALWLPRCSLHTIQFTLFSILTDIVHQINRIICVSTFFVIEQPSLVML